jgi:hypothetical protein
MYVTLESFKWPIENGLLLWKNHIKYLTYIMAHIYHGLSDIDEKLGHD